MNNLKPKILKLAIIKRELKNLAGWQYENNKIFKQFEFASFKQGIRFINKLAPLFDKVDHHADMHIFYKKILFELRRYDIGGKVTDRDIMVAKKIEKEYQSLP